MKKLIIYSNWNKQDIKKTWSGTGYALLVGLKKMFDVQDVGMMSGTITNFIFKISRYSNMVSRLFYQIQNLHFKLRHKSDIPTFMISEVLDVPNEKYLYFDNIWHTVYLFRQLKNLENSNYNKWSFDKIFSYSSESNLELQVKRQYQIMKSAKCIFCMGNWLVNYIVEVYPEFKHKTIAVGGGINIPKLHFKIENKSKNKTILFVGRDFYRKGGDLVVDAFHLLKQKYPNVRLIIAGPQNKPSEVIDDIIFKGDLPNEEIGLLMTQCDVFCMPSRFEAYGLVFIEALVSGLPCVARNAFEMPYFIENGVTGRLIDHDSPKELADALNDVLHNSLYRKNVEERKKWYMKEYCWENVCTKISNYII